MKKTVYAIVLFLATTLGGVPILYAGCMDDAGDAVLAFFSGGASYAICSTIETVESLIRSIEIMARSMERMTRDTITAAQRGVNETANSIVTNTNNIMRQMSNLANEGNRLASSLEAAASRQPAVARQLQQQATPAAAGALQQAQLNSTAIQGVAQQSAGAPASPAASPEELRNTMRQAADTLTNMHSTLASQQANQILGAMDIAKNHAIRHAEAAGRIAETSVMAPLRQMEEMLNGLLRNPARIFDPSAMINESMERLTRAMTQVTEQIHREITNEALATIRDVDQQLQKLTGDNEKATKIHEAMAKANQRRDQASLNELRSLLGVNRSGGGAGGTSPVIRAAALNPALNATALIQQIPLPTPANRALQNEFDALKRSVNSFESAQQLGKQGKLPAHIERNAKAELDRMLANKTPAEAETVKRQLKEQLKRRAQQQNNPKAVAALDQDFDQKFAQVLQTSSVIKKGLTPTQPALTPMTPAPQPAPAAKPALTPQTPAQAAPKPGLIQPGAAQPAPALKPATQPQMQQAPTQQMQQQAPLKPAVKQPGVIQKQPAPAMQAPAMKQK